jgi:hypothetical protein
MIEIEPEIIIGTTHIETIVHHSLVIVGKVLHCAMMMEEGDRMDGMAVNVLAITANKLLAKTPHFNVTRAEEENMQGWAQRSSKVVQEVIRNLPLIP